MQVNKKIHLLWEYLLGFLSSMVIGVSLFIFGLTVWYIWMYILVPILLPEHISEIGQWTQFIIGMLILIFAFVCVTMAGSR